MQGKLIVIDGADGAGKATQTKLLVEKLRADERQVETLDFPQYAQNNFGKLLRESLDGKRGNFLTLDPKIASTIFAADRFESKPQLERWLAEGKIVVLDRYVSSNMLHQASKITDQDERKEFLNWLDTIEHGVFKVPRPDVILYLDIPYEVRKNLMDSDGNRIELDQVERDEEYNRAAETQATELLAHLNNWQCIVCTKDNLLRSKESIHTNIYQIVSKSL